jgi:hypothetical protein
MANPAEIGKLHELIDEHVKMGDIEPGGLFLLSLSEILTKHLYVRIKSPADAARLASDPIPNRHAAIHGQRASPKWRG